VVGVDKRDNHLEEPGNLEEEVVDMKVGLGEGVGILELLVVEVVVDLGNLLVAVVEIVIMLQQTRLISATIFFDEERRKGVHTLI
jgi:hypothetical protein